jgi:hypothetical protein
MTKDQQQQILNAAADVFSRKGYNGTTITDIASLAGVNPATIYRYFSGKRELFDALGKPELDFPDQQEEQTRLTIQKAALRVFSQKGYAAATMDGIAEERASLKPGFTSITRPKKTCSKPRWKIPPDSPRSKTPSNHGVTVNSLDWKRHYQRWLLRT